MSRLARALVVLCTVAAACTPQEVEELPAPDLRRTIHPTVAPPDAYDGRPLVAVGLAVADELVMVDPRGARAWRLIDFPEGLVESPRTTVFTGEDIAAISVANARVALFEFPSGKTRASRGLGPVPEEEPAVIREAPQFGEDLLLGPSGDLYAVLGHAFERASEVVTMDPKTLEVVSRLELKTDFEGVWNGAAFRRASELWIPSLTRQRNWAISIVSLDSGKVRQVPVDDPPGDLELGPRGSMFVQLGVEGAVVELGPDGEERGIIDGFMPGLLGLEIGAQGIGIVTGEWERPEGDYLYLVDFARREILDQFEVTRECPQPREALMVASRAVITCFARVGVLQVDPFSLLETIPVGERLADLPVQEEPRGLSLIEA